MCVCVCVCVCVIGTTMVLQAMSCNDVTDGYHVYAIQDWSKY